MAACRALLINWCYLRIEYRALVDLMRRWIRRRMEERTFDELHIGLPAMPDWRGKRSPAFLARMKERDCHRMSMIRSHSSLHVKLLAWSFIFSTEMAGSINGMERKPAMMEPRRLARPAR